MIIRKLKRSKESQEIKTVAQQELVFQGRYISEICFYVQSASKKFHSQQTYLASTMQLQLTR